MKNLFTIALLLNTSLYAMDCGKKKYKHHYQDAYTKLINMDKKELHDMVTNTTIKDLQRKRISQPNCFDSMSKFILKQFNNIQHYLNK